MVCLALDEVEFFRGLFGGVEVFGQGAPARTQALKSRDYSCGEFAPGFSGGIGGVRIAVVDRGDEEGFRPAHLGHRQGPVSPPLRSPSRNPEAGFL
jgi:hypothetical protein